MITMAKATSKTKDSKARTEIRTHIDENGRERQFKVYYDDNGEIWALQDVTRADKVVRRPFRPEDRHKIERPNGEVWWIDTLPDPDEIVTWTDDDGQEYSVAVSYGDQDWRPIVAHILANHPEMAVKLFGIYLPAFDKKD
jgi:hypothetical protein